MKRFKKSIVLDIEPLSLPSRFFDGKIRELIREQTSRVVGKGVCLVENQSISLRG